MGFRASLVAAALLALPSNAGAAQITLDAERQASGDIDQYEIDVLGSLTEEEAAAGACVWLHSDGFARLHDRSEAPSAAEPGTPPRGQADNGWWYKVGCTNVAGNSVIDAAAAATYPQKESRESTVTAYFLRQSDDAVMAQDSIAVQFIGRRLMNRTRVAGAPPPSKGRRGAPHLELRASATHRAGQDGLVSSFSYERGYAGARFKLNAEVVRGPRQRHRRYRVTAGSGRGSMIWLFRNREPRELRFRVMGGGRYFDDPVGRGDDIFEGPSVTGVQIKILESDISYCPKGHYGWLHVMNGQINQIFLDLCGDRAGWLAPPPQVDLKIFRTRR